MLKIIFNFFKPKYRIAMRLVENNDKEIVQTNFIIQQNFLLFWHHKSINFGLTSPSKTKVNLLKQKVLYKSIEDAENALNKYIINKDICKYIKNKIVIIPSEYYGVEYSEDKYSLLDYMTFIFNKLNKK